MLTAEEVSDVAKLARIELSSEEITTFQSDLSKVLIFFKELEALSTEHEKNAGHITGRANEARTDIVNEATTATREIIHNNFPESEEGFLKVRSVF